MEVPNDMKFDPFDYQHEMVEWLYERKNAALSRKMALSFIHAVSHQNG